MYIYIYIYVLRLFGSRSARGGGDENGLSSSLLVVLLLFVFWQKKYRNPGMNLSKSRHAKEPASGGRRARGRG